MNRLEMVKGPFWKPDNSRQSLVTGGIMALVTFTTPLKTSELEYLKLIATVKLAGDYGLDFPVVVGILAALSPGTNYDQNKKDSENLIKLEKGVIQAAKFTTYGANVRKAKKILKGEKNPLEYFSMKTGAKTYSFYCNILNPEGNEVTIDRHAYLIATGEGYSGLTPKQYLSVAAHYVKHALKIGILPLELQAVLWVNHRIENDIQQRKE